MKTLLTICALAAGAGLAATGNSAEAQCYRGGGYGFGGGYSYYPSYNRGFNNYGYNRGYVNYGHHHHRGFQGYGYSNHHHRGYGWGGRNRGFSLQTRNFGIRIR